MAEPGAGYHYANTNYLVLGEIIERVTSRPWHAEVRSRIIGPLGLRHTGYAGEPSAPRIGAGYVVVDGKFTNRADVLARFGFGDFVLLSSPGQHRWVDLDTNTLRAATVQDARDAIRLADALPNISFVGGIAQTAEISERFREVALTAELVRSREVHLASLMRWDSPPESVALSRARFR